MNPQARQARSKEKYTLVKVVNKHIYTIPADQNFSDTLAHWVLEKYKSDPLQLSRVLMLLPSRRSCIALRDAFLRASEGRPLLLPRMQPIGDVDEDILLLGGEWKLVEGKLPPQAFAFKRLFILANLIQRYNGSRLDHAIELAVELARLFDELECEQVSLKELVNVVPEDFAEHWQVTVEFLKIISEHWPQIANEENIISPVTYRNEVLSALSRQWKAAAPDYPVVVAGTTGSIPASAELIATIASLQNGTVILPSLDSTLNEESIEYFAESHPQWGMCRLLDKIGCSVKDVREIKFGVSRIERVRLLSEIMSPAELSENWQTLMLDVDNALSGMKRLVCSDIQEEASVVALILRAILEQPKKTAALVTHDRVLARRVSVSMKRFGVIVDYSAGTPLSETPLAVFLRLVAEVATEGLHEAPVILLSLLKHPLTQVGMKRIECLETAREYELQILRADKTRMPEVSDNVKRLLKNLEHIFAPFIQLLNKSLPLTISQVPDLLKAHLQCAEALASEDLWSSAEAESIVKLLTELQMADVQKEKKDYGNYQSGRTCYKEVFDNVFAGQVFRSEYGGHPRLKILSPIEARMQSFDCIILGGLNEGSWPQSTGFDPWLNRKIRADIGLPSPERSIGLAAHDFFTLASAPEIYLTRSEKIDGTPATASRWLVKLDVLLARFSKSNLADDRYWQGIATALNKPLQHQEISAPEPKPPLAARPKTLSVTQIETLLRNPYAVYASRILGLKALEPIMRELSASDFGNAVHKVLEKFVKAYPAALPKDAYENLIQYSEEILRPFLANERIRALWWPRFTRIARFVIEEERKRRAGAEVSAEVSESYSFDGFTLTGRADRIERYKDGMTIVDYKTGVLPTDTAIENGVASQLVLLGLIMKEKSNTIKSLEYWQLQGGADAGKIKALTSQEADDYMGTAKEELRALVKKFNNPDFPYRSTPLPARAGHYNDYAHLARIKEWQD